MAYIGQGIKQGTFSVLDTSGNTYNGSNTTFSLGTQVGSPAQLLVSHDGVLQKPGTDYSLASGGTQITFSTAPASGASIFIVEISGAVGGPLDSDLNGTELILDADGDTSITADTDDQIDIKVAGADDFQIVANNFKVLSGSTLTIESGGTITNSGTASGFGVALDDVSTGDAASTLATSTGNITVDAQGNDTDIIFKGTDNNSDTTFLTLDGSEGGQLVLGAHGQINFPDSANVSTDANVLDDYQEGTFNLSSSQASNFFTGFYTKIGRMVFFTCAGQVPSSGNSATQTLTGMPFTTKDQAASDVGSDSAAGFIAYESNNGKTASLVLTNNSTQANFFQNDNNVATHATYSGDHFILGGMYTTDS
jgi:hypothetical protein